MFDSEYIARLVGSPEVKTQRVYELGKKSSTVIKRYWGNREMRWRVVNDQEIQASRGLTPYDRPPSNYFSAAYLPNMREALPMSQMDWYRGVYSCEELDGH